MTTTKHTPGPQSGNDNYDAAMLALHAATSDSFAWDASWAPEALQPRVERAYRILGAAILAERAAKLDLLAACKELCDEIDDAIRHDYDNEHRTRVLKAGGRARDAIAKVEGGQS